MAKMHSNRIFTFGVEKIKALPQPEKGKRATYRDARVKHLFLRVTPTAKTFFFQRTIKGKKIVLTIDQFDTITVATARKRVDDINARYALGEDVAQAIKEKREEITLDDLWQEYRRRRPKAKTSDTLREGQQYVEGTKVIESKANLRNYNVHFKHWENLALSEITFDMARDLIKEIWETGGKDGMGRIPHGNRVFNLGKAMFKFAIKELDWQGQNPFRFSKVSEADRSRTNKRLYRGDMSAFMEALETLTPTQKLCILTALFTGRRIGECRAMRWVDIDLETQVWNIPFTKTTDAGQTAVLGDFLASLLIEWKKQTLSPWVFPSSWSKSGHINNTSHSWNKVRKFGFEHLNLNDLRGTAGSWAQEIEAFSLAQAAQQLGHDSIETTKKKYTHLDPLTQVEGINKVEADMLEAAGIKNGDKC